ncbi:MAG: Hpt domain-containing protein, partial [Bdellovibrionales bacterium]|nr:Hpt domain-containing protein [Bdellovibrionales bacterium]
LEPVFILDSELVILYCNETASHLTDLSPRKIIRSKKKITDLFQFSENVDFLENISSQSAPSPYKEIKFNTQAITEGKSQITLQPFTKDSWILFFRDVTLEERLQKKYRAELEQKEVVISDLEAAREQLEVYSKKLESLVEERTIELSSLNKMMKALLDSLNQAFFVFNSDGKCLPIYSKACLSILEQAPNGKMIWDILNVTTEKQQGFKNWLLTLFQEMLPFEDLAPLGPSRRQHSLDKEISIEYYPIRSTEGTIEAVVCVANDITDLVAAKKQAEGDRAKVESILKIVQHKKQVQLFFNESLKDIAKIRSFVSKEFSPGKTDTEEISRQLHTLKGGAASFYYQDLKSYCHTCENLLESLKNNYSEDLWESFYSTTQQIEKELFNIKEDFQKIFGTDPVEFEEKISISKNDFNELIQHIESSEIKKNLMQKYLYTPISEQIDHYQNIIESTAKILNKEAPAFSVSGAGIKVPQNRFNYLFQVLIHAIRNSLDHGIESSEDRLQLNKPINGKINLTFSLNKSNDQEVLMIIIEDDGRGIDSNAIRRKLIELNSPLSNQSDEEIIYRIFDPSFSTRQEASEISGRGVGMNAILEEVLHLNGKIEIQTIKNQFTKFLIQIPLEQPSRLQKAS